MEGDCTAELLFLSFIPQLAAIPQLVALKRTFYTGRADASVLTHMNPFLAEATRTLATHADSTLTLQRVARAAVPVLADFCLIVLIARGSIHIAATAHATREGDRLLRRLARVYHILLSDPLSTVAQAVRARRTQLRREITTEHDPRADRLRVDTIHRQLAPVSALVAPIAVRGRIVGALSLCQAASGRHFTTRDVPVVERLARKIGGAIESGLTARASGPEARSGPRPRARLMLRRKPRSLALKTGIMGPCPPPSTSHSLPRS